MGRIALTSSGFRDAWTVAYNPEYVIGVWVGNVDGAPGADLTGKRLAAPLVWQICRELYPNNDAPWPARPEGLARRAVCAVSGCPAGPNCPRAVEDWYIRGVTTFRPCGVHAEPPDADGVAREHWPAEVAAFLKSHVEVAERPVRSAAARALAIASPKPGGVYRKMPDSPAWQQRLPLAATGGEGDLVHWFVDDVPVVQARAGESLYWEPAVGRHAIVCCDAAGRSARCEIVVD